MNETEALHDARLVGLLDPAAELLRGALPYADAPAELPDDMPVPTLQVRRRVDAPGLRVAIDRFLGVEPTGHDELDVDRLPVDRSSAPPRRRVAPMPETPLRLVGGDAVPSAAPGSADATGRLELPAPGPGPQEVATVVAAASRHRMVLVDPSVGGDPALLAGLLLQVMAAGTVCWCPSEVVDRLELLGPGLRAALRFDPEPLATDDLLLAARAAAQRRCAWHEHDLRLAWSPDREDTWRPRLTSVPWPAVSIVLASRRPAVVPLALELIAAQRGVEVEVVVALHGDGDPAEIDAHRQRLGLEGRTARVATAVPFGAVLNHAVSLTTGSVVLKWDDDDLYGPHHVQDLLVARRQTSAALVGKAAEFVYFEASAGTIWRNPARAEAPSVGMAGGTFLTDRAVLDEVGGYPEVSRAVDHHLKIRLRDRGLATFRTHGFGFVLRRHAQGHTWDATEERLRSTAVRSFDGLPDVLDLGDAARITTLPPA